MFHHSNCQKKLKNKYFYYVAYLNLNMLYPHVPFVCRDPLVALQKR